MTIETVCIIITTVVNVLDHVRNVIKDIKKK